MSLTTANGNALHPIGVGTWDIASRINDEIPDGRYRNVEAVRGNEGDEIEGIRYSIGRGQNHLDCAELYGAFYTDEVVGAAIQEQTVGRTRQALFIADKLWRHSVAPGAVKPTVEQMLSKLGTDYLDLLYIHAPWPDVNWRTAIPQIDELIDAKVVRHFGVSSFTIDQMREVQSITRHPIRANQMNFNCLYRDEVNDEFRAFCGENEIAIVAYQPVKRGEVLSHPAIKEIANAHDATPAQIALAWLLHVGTLPIPKAIQKTHIDENLEALEISLTDDELAKIASI